MLVVDYGFTRGCVKHFLDEVVFNDMRSSRLVGTLENHDGTKLGHPSGIAALRAPGFFKLLLHRRDRACWLTGADKLVYFPLPAQSYPHLSSFLPQAPGMR